jgi:hypothetical protein
LPFLIFLNSSLQKNKYSISSILNLYSLYLYTVLKTLKIALIVAASLLYGMAVFLMFGTLISQNAQSGSFQQRHSETEFFTEPDFTEAFALPAKILLVAEAGCPVTFSSFQQHKFSYGIYKSSEQTETDSWSRYHFNWLSFSIGLTRGDIIFPFHSFW